MKLGVIARAEDRGLGSLTREFVAHMKPERTLVIRPVAADDAGLAFHDDWYPGATAARWHPERQPLNEDAVREWLDGLDVVYSAETFYDWRICEWARELGVRTVCHMMPEYWKAETFTKVDAWWTPTRWRLGKLPEAVKVVPVPIAIERFTRTWTPVPTTPLTWLHPAGARALKDRNGTMQFLRAIPHLKEKHRIVIRAQNDLPFASAPANVDLVMHDRDHTNYWDPYDGIDVVIIPRKYGGLCMPALEAMGAGCALAMTDVSPQSTEWPILPIPASRALVGGTLSVYDHLLPLAVAQPEDIATVMDACAADPGRVMVARERALGFAFANSWDKRKPEIVGALARACD